MTSMDAIAVWFPLGRNFDCVMEKASTGWQLRVLERGTTVLTHPIDPHLAARLLSARCNAAGGKRASTGPIRAASHTS